MVKPSIMIALFITLLFSISASDYLLRRWTRKGASPYPAQVYLQGKVAVRNVMLPRFMWARRRIDAAPTFIWHLAKPGYLSDFIWRRWEKIVKNAGVGTRHLKYHLVSFYAFWF